MHVFSRIYFRRKIKINFLLILYLLTAFNILEAQDFVTEYAVKQNKISKTGMVVLGSWAVGNLITNAALSSNSSVSDKYFKQMNIYWNVVNLAIAGGGYWATKKEEGNELTIYNLLSRQHKTEKALLFNAGLDIAYMATGQLLKERAQHKIAERDRLEGFGNSLLLQGAFLFTFDIILHTRHAQHKKRNNPQFNNIKLSMNSGGIRMYF